MSRANSAIEPIKDGWSRLEALVESLGPSGLGITGSDGWAVKDHLIHIAAWELSLLALLEGADRAKEMGAPGLDDTDEINHAVWLAHRQLTPEQAVQHFRAVHARLMAALEKMSDDELQLSYNHYQSDYPKESPAGDRPALDWVAGNTYEHYGEHIEWINHLIESSKAR